jgi:hypothetical protein
MGAEKAENIFKTEQQNKEAADRDRETKKRIRIQMH